MKNKRGFTLVELLGVIVILAVIAAITIPTVTGIIKKNKEKAYNATVATIIDASKKWSSDNSSMVSDTGDSYVKLDTLTEGYIDQDELINPITNNTMDGCVKISHSDTYNQYEYSYETKDECPNFILDVVLTSFPELEVGDNGCKTFDSTKNYSYMGGCYLKGAQTKNYLWYSGFLWRIMGVNKDKTVRLITEEDVTAIPQNPSGNPKFVGSYIDSWLNDYFYSKLRGTNIIVNSSFCQGAAVTSAPTRTDCTGGTTLSRNVGLLSIDEYDLASSSSYLKNSQSFVTMSPYSDSNIWIVSYGGNSYNADVGYTSGTRSVININSVSLITSGDGTLSSTWSSTSSPYILSENKTSDVTGSIADNVTSGEYVSLAGKTYRVVNKETNGVKLILDGYYQSTADTNDQLAVGTNSTFSTITGIGQTLNTTILDWLIPSTNTTNRSKLVTDSTWYQNDFNYGYSYTNSLNETSPTRTISATVGLIRIGEMLSNQSYTILTKNGTTTSSYKNASSYWMLNSYNTLNESVTENDGHAFVTCVYGCDYFSAARPVIVVNNTTQITSGTGTPSNPYNI